LISQEEEEEGKKREGQNKQRDTEWKGEAERQNLPTAKGINKIAKGKGKNTHSSAEGGSRREIGRSERGENKY
jgi:hypothetical protein